MKKYAIIIGKTSALAKKASMIADKIVGDELDGTEYSRDE